MILALYVGGFMEQLFMESAVRLAPIDTIRHGISSVAGIQCSIVAFILFGAVAGLIVWRGSGKEAYDERNFEVSSKGTYGTAGFMDEEERAQVLQSEKSFEKVDGVIFGRNLQDEKIISLPVESRLNRNFAVCGSQGSMKSRAFARVMALQCIRRGESVYLTDPKSELYEDLSFYFRESGYTVKQLNLIQLEHSDAWNCLGEIDDGSLIDVFCDVVIRNTTDKFDHFYDNTEMDLLKALCLYVFHEYPPEKRTFPEAYKLLINKSVDMLDAIFDRLPTHHPARGPYQLFAKAEKVKGNAVGVEVSVRARDMAWEWMVDAGEKFQVGDLTLVMVNKINIRSLEEIDISVDAKGATANTNKDNLKRCVRQGKYVGIITDIYKGTYFIRLNIGVNAVAHSCNMTSLPSKRDEVGFVVTRINDKFEVAEGIITRMIKRAV